MTLQTEEMKFLEHIQALANRKEFEEQKKKEEIESIKRKVFRITLFNFVPLVSIKTFEICWSAKYIKYFIPQNQRFKTENEKPIQKSESTANNVGAIKRNESPSKLLVSFFPLSSLPVAKDAFKLNKLFGCFCFYLGLIAWVCEFVFLFCQLFLCFDDFCFSYSSFSSIFQVKILSRTFDLKYKP